MQQPIMHKLKGVMALNLPSATILIFTNGDNAK